MHAVIPKLAILIPLLSICRQPLSSSSSAKGISAALNLAHIALADPQLRALEASNTRRIHAPVLPPLAAAAAVLFTFTLRAPLQNDAVLLGLAPALGLARARGRDDALAHVHRHALLLQYRPLGAERLEPQVRRLLPRAAGGEGLGLGGGAVHDGRGEDGGRGGVVVAGGEEVRLGEEAAQLEVLREEGGGVLGEGLGGLGGGGRGGGFVGGLGGRVVDDFGGLWFGELVGVGGGGRGGWLGRTMNALSSRLLICGSFGACGLEWSITSTTGTSSSSS